LREHLERTPAKNLEEKKKVLNAFKDRQLFLIDAAHLLKPRETLLEFSYALTDLGEVVLEEASRVCSEHLIAREGSSPIANPSFAIFGLGKFGGREMGYASDLELLFVHDSPKSGPFCEALARLMVDFIEARSHGIFHIDLRLRPYGEAGPWSAPFEGFTKYYSASGDAAPFERQALIKLRWIAGDEDLGRRVETHRDTFTYSGLPWDWADAMQLRRRQMLEIAQPGQTNVKYSAGGIIDIEYAVQYLLLLNGAEHPEIRLHATLDALQALRRLQIVRETDFSTLHGGYLFLRNLIDGLRIVRGDATDLVLPGEQSEEFKSLARRLGYREADRVRGAARLAADIRESMKRVHDYFILRFQFEGAATKDRE
jgi:glutamate-ammonia-ligase adenylyltransferase